jgi:glucokinase
MASGGQADTGMWLVADIGGMNARLLPPGSTQPQQETNLLCADFPGRNKLRHYLTGAGISVKEAASTSPPRSPATWSS